MANEEELGAYTIPDFGRAFRVGRTLIYEEIKRKRLKAVKVGSKTLILKPDAARWAANLPALHSSVGAA